jgi:VWFA-related protein
MVGMAILLSCRRRWPLIAVVLFCAGLSEGVATDPESHPAEYAYRTNTTEVRLNFSAMDQNNHGVATLQASDFAVVDKDVIVRNYQSFTRSDWTKLEIGILMDGSESVAPHFRQEMADVLDLVSQTAGVPDENLSMFSFDGSRPALLCAGDCRSSHAAEGLPVTRAQGLTPLFDTVVFAADFLAHHGDPQSEKALIVFSDGVDTVSRNSLRDAIDSSLKNEVQLDCIDLNRASQWSQGAAVLQRLASATGGRYFPSPDGAIHALNVILGGFRASYTVSYRLPSHASGFHAVRILPTHNLNLQFRSRSGYYYPNQVR